MNKQTQLKYSAKLIEMQQQHEKLELNREKMLFKKENKLLEREQMQGAIDSKNKSRFEKLRKQEEANQIKREELEMRKQQVQREIRAQRSAQQRIRLKQGLLSVCAVYCAIWLFNLRQELLLIWKQSLSFCLPHVDFFFFTVDHYCLDMSRFIPLEGFCIGVVMLLYLAIKTRSLVLNVLAFLLFIVVIPFFYNTRLHLRQLCGLIPICSLQVVAHLAINRYILANTNCQRLSGSFTLVVVDIVMVAASLLLAFVCGADSGTSSSLHCFDSPNDFVNCYSP